MSRRDRIKKFIFDFCDISLIVFVGFSLLYILTVIAVAVWYIASIL